MITELRDPFFMTTAEINDEVVHLHAQKQMFEAARKVMDQMPQAFESYQQALEQSYLPDFDIIEEKDLVAAVMQIYIRLYGSKYVTFTDADMATHLEKFGYRLKPNMDHPISRYDLKNLINNDHLFERHQLQDQTTLLVPLQSWIDLCTHVLSQKQALQA